jgi:transaldolase
MRPRRRTFRRTLALLQSLGAPVVIVAECTRCVHGDKAARLGFGADDRPVLTEAEWGRLCAGLSKFAALSAAAGLKLVYHHHMGTVIQSEAELDRLLASVPALHLLFDPGHLAFAGIDPLAVARRHGARIAHVHLKSVRREIAGRARREGWSFYRAVRERSVHDSRRRHGGFPRHLRRARRAPVSRLARRRGRGGSRAGSRAAQGPKSPRLCPHPRRCLTTHERHPSVPHAQMTALGADWWNDSGVPAELGEAVGLGATGGTSNPVIVYQTVKANPGPLSAGARPAHHRLSARHRGRPDLEAHPVLGRESAKKLLPVFEATKGAKGYLSMQVNPKYYPSAEHMVAHATELAALAPNIAIKAPATETGIAAMEEMTARGIRINATVSFSVAQALAMAAGIERGLKRARAAGRNADAIRPYITLMIGRVDDQLRRVAEAQKIAVTPGAIDWAGIAVFKHAHRLFQARGLPGTLLAAAYRHEGHWSQLIGREVLQTIPYNWWTKFNTSATAPALTLDAPVDGAILAELRAKFPDFVRAHDEDGMKPAEFLGYGATLHTLHQFLGGYADLLALVRGRMIPM